MRCKNYQWSINQLNRTLLQLSKLSTLQTSNTPRLYKILKFKLFIKLFDNDLFSSCNFIIRSSSTTTLSLEEYDTVSSLLLENLTEQLQDLLSEYSNFDVDLNSGVLTVKLDNHGTYVINRQPYNKQIWFSSPISADVGLIGLAVMGQNLILNMNDHGYTVCAYNRTVEKVQRFLDNEAKGAFSIEEFCLKLKKPRKIILLVKAGKAVDDFIYALLPFLEKGDIVIDGGNSHFPDTIRRTNELEAKGFLFVGCGVSGGEEGARYGPSIMPGGSKSAWPHIKDVLQSIAAKSDNEPCCDWVGDSGAGHYVKMVHNGIEYGDMQLICEAYQILKEGLGLTNDEISSVFEDWNKRELDSFLIEITRDILKYKENNEYVLDKIRDAAGQKGTGKWTAVSSLDMGVPVTLIGEAVFSRCLSAIKDERIEASKILKGPKIKKINVQSEQEKKQLIDKIESALYSAKIISYAQGFMLLREAAKQYNWELNYGGVAVMWKGGCIIRSAFLGDIKNAYRNNPDLKNLLFDPFFTNAITKHQQNWRELVSVAVLSGIPIPAMSSALAFYDGYRSEKLPANLLQAQRDYFGAHTYETLESPGTWTHTNWTGRGGNVSSSSYQV